MSFGLTFEIQTKNPHEDFIRVKSAQYGSKPFVQNPNIKPIASK
jgi:hypothetical protein